MTSRNESNDIFFSLTFNQYKNDHNIGFFDCFTCWYRHELKAIVIINSGLSIRCTYHSNVVVCKGICSQLD